MLTRLKVLLKTVILIAKIGFRPWKRCQPQNATAINPARDKVIAAIGYIEA